ncbi:hypothetical protein M501DRAFT_924319 [Patellaria atrata CBS 101060]|uniref:Ribonuclease H2 subunit B n=1 Tax=Patellaria atrata CBS 101060 TaxID=1346257 RepID=A0A9P4SJE1_9PEZI|nr:hypothetical protein M501DRAFT_924319 [Patellaria atrata CBS 101060]
MARIRSKPAPKEAPPESTVPKKCLQPSVSDPPKLFILPKNVSSDSRIVSLQNPATNAGNRYFFCPDRGFYEFTRIAAPKNDARSWLLTPHLGKDLKEGENPSLSDGYIASNPDLFVATPYDPLFMLLPILASKSKPMFLSLDDHLEHASSIIQWKELLDLPSVRGLLTKRMEAICDITDLRDEKMYRFSENKLVNELISKAKRMTNAGLPASMEEHFVRRALEKPLMSVMREDSGASVQRGDTETPFSKNRDSQTVSESTNDSQQSINSNTTVSTSVTSVSSDSERVQSVDANAEIDAPEGIPQLLRLRTALDFISSLYLSKELKNQLASIMKETRPIDFQPLETHLDSLAKIRSEVQALRSISDNINKKRRMADDEVAEEQAEKKRKLEEEEKKKKTESRAIKNLKRVDTSGMKKLSSFFTKAPAKAA